MQKIGKCNPSEMYKQLSRETFFNVQSENKEEKNK